MAGIIDYTSLKTAFGSWQKRTYTDAQNDEVIGLAEGEFRLYFGPNFALETGSAVLTFTAGVASLPAGFIRPLGLSHTTNGDVRFGTIGDVNALNDGSAAGNPEVAAISGSSIFSAPLYTGTATLSYEGSLVGLSGTNTTNWLILNAPQAYLSMCLSMANARLKAFDQAATFRQAAIQTLKDLGIQSMVAQYGRAQLRMRGATP